MLAMPSRSKVPQYKILKRQTDEVVGRINGKFASVNWTQSGTTIVQCLLKI